MRQSAAWATTPRSAITAAAAATMSGTASVSIAAAAASCASTDHLSTIYPIRGRDVKVLPSLLFCDKIIDNYGKEE